jgi:hypothetical protein
MENMPGLRSAALLYELGLSGAAIIRGLMIEVGLTYDEAALTATAAELAHSHANRGRRVPSCVRARRPKRPS